LFYDDVFGEITQNEGHYAIQGHSRSSILAQIDFLLVINTNLPPILHRFRDISFNRSKIAIFCYPLAFNPAAVALHHITGSDILLKKLHSLAAFLSLKVWVYL